MVLSCLLVLCSYLSALYVSMLYGSSAFSVFSVLYRSIVYCVYINGMCASLAYGLLATCRELLGSFWGLSLDKLLGSLLGDFSGKLPGERSGSYMLSGYYKLWE